jgi:phage shock protein PspC (stress-responsive transcriptional regulator)
MIFREGILSTTMKRIYRERFDKKIGGVCGGLGQYMRFDPSIIRLIFLLLAIFTGGLFILVYLLLWLIFPIGPKSYVETHYKRLYRSRRDRRFAGICGGFGKYLRIDSNILRIALIILMVLTGFVPILLAYLIGMIIIPEEVMIKY